jgi:hypothetical protein
MNRDKKCEQDVCPDGHATRTHYNVYNSFILAIYLIMTT